MANSGAVAADTGWILPTLATDVTVSAGVTSGHYGIRKVGKIVFLSVSLAIANPAASKLLFTLDPAYRPATPSAGGSILAAMASGSQIQVRTDGTVRTFISSASAVGTMSWPV